MKAETYLDFDLDGPPVEVSISDLDWQGERQLLISTNVSEDVLISVVDGELVLETVDANGDEHKITLATREDLGL